MDENTDRESMIDEIESFLIANFPQIKAHGGEFKILEADPSDGFASIQLAGACSGCGVSPMTVEAIRDRLPKRVDSVDMIMVETGKNDGI